MLYKALSTASVVLAATRLVSAQTSTSCNPLNATCPDDAALGTTVTVDFTQGASDVFVVDEGTNITYDSTMGAVFTINTGTDAPTIYTSKYIFFGKVEAVVQAAPGTGVITSIVLLSDDLDEIDWEWLGGDTTNLQSDYFGKDDQDNPTAREGVHDVTDPQSTFHTYTIDWTTASIVWSIDGTVVRTLNYADADYSGGDPGSRFPQTPCQVKLGTWDGGAASEPTGTVEWAGGYTDFDDAPFKAYYKSITITDYAGNVTGATSYHYSDNSGDWESIEVIVGDNSTESSSSSSISSTESKTSTSSSSKTSSTTDSTSTGAKNAASTNGSTATKSSAGVFAQSSATGVSSASAAPKQGLGMILMGATATGLILSFLVL